MFSKRNDKSGHIKVAEKNEGEREEEMLGNKIRACKREISDRKDNVGKAIGKEFQENKDKGQGGLKGGQEGGKEGREDLGFSIPWRGCWRPRP